MFNSLKDASLTILLINGAVKNTAVYAVKYQYDPQVTGTKALIKFFISNVAEKNT